MSPPGGKRDTEKGDFNIDAAVGARRIRPRAIRGVRHFGLNLSVRTDYDGRHESQLHEERQSGEGLSLPL
jgi:hypothetical protein